MAALLNEKQRRIVGNIMAEAQAIKDGQQQRIGLRKFVRMPVARVKEYDFMISQLLPVLLDRIGEDEIPELDKMLGPDTDFGVDLPVEKWEF